MEQNNIPTKSRLSAASMFAPSEEERLAAKRLLKAGLYRVANKDEITWEDHPFNLAGLFPADAYVEALVSSQPEELGGNELEIHVTEPPSPPAKPVAPVAEEPPLGESMEKLVRHPLKPRAPRIQLPQWTKGEPYVGDDFGRPPLDW
jgi:hypothetical protein